MRRTALVACLIFLALLSGCQGYDAALMDAIRANEVGNVQRLLDAGADAKSIPKGEHQYPIEEAARVGNAEIVRLLIAHGAHPDSSTSEKSPLYLAIHHDHAPAATALVEAGASLEGPQVAGMDLVYQAVMLDDTALVGAMLRAGASIHARGILGGLMHEAADNGNLPMMQLLLQNGLDLDARNELGETPMYIAGSSKKWAAIQWLSAHGASPNIPNQLGNALLHEVASAADTAAIELLCALDADPNIQNKIGQTALHIAAAKGDLPTLRALIAHCHPNLSLRDHRGLSPAAVAYNAENQSALDYLISQGARLR